MKKLLAPILFGTLLSSTASFADFLEEGRERNISRTTVQHMIDTNSDTFTIGNRNFTALHLPRHLYSPRGSFNATWVPDTGRWRVDISHNGQENPITHELVMLPEFFEVVERL